MLFSALKKQLRGDSLCPSPAQVTTNNGSGPSTKKLSADNNSAEHVLLGKVQEPKATFKNAKNQKRSKNLASKQNSGTTTKSSSLPSDGHLSVISQMKKRQDDDADSDEQSDVEDEEELQDAEHLNQAVDEARRGPEVRLALYRCHADGSAKRFTALGERKFSATLGRMIMLFALLNLPLQLVMVLHYFVPQQQQQQQLTDSNSDGLLPSGFFDYLYLGFIPIAFLSTFINPLMVGATMTERKSLLAFSGRF